MKIIVGKVKKREEKDCVSAEKFVFALGIILMCIILIAPLVKSGTDSFESEAVMVMNLSTSENAEKIELPEHKGTLAEDKWSFFDYIGELFAGLLFGEW